MHVELTPQMIAHSRVIAKGNRIRDVKRLVSDYGGQVSGWSKKSSPPIVREGKRVEYHWYEHHGIGRFEIKLKELPAQ